MALINAGLGIASGTSQNALENIAKGAVPGLTSYTQGLKDLRDDERSIRKELRGVDALQRGESREDRMLDKKLIAQLEAAGITNSLELKNYLLKVRQDSRERIKSKGYDDLSNVSDSVVKRLGYTGEDRKSQYISDLEAAMTLETVDPERLTKRQKNLLNTLPSDPVSTQD
jgi:hypothetical protein